MRENADVETSPADEVVLRAARPDDARAIAHLHVGGWQSYRGLLPDAFLDDPARPAEVERRWTSQLRRPTDVAGELQVWVAEHARAVVGFTSFGPCLDPVARRSDEAIDLWVAADRRGGGIGSRLLGLLLARTRRPTVFWVLRGNDRAAALYARHGAVRAGMSRTTPMPAGPTWPGFDMVDDLLVIL